MSWLKLIPIIESLKHFAKQKWRHQGAGNKRWKQLGFLTFELGRWRPDCQKRILFWSKTSKSRACSGVKLQTFGACSGFLEVKNRPWSVAHTRIPDIRKFPPPRGYSWYIASLENHRKSLFEFFSSYYLLKSYFGTCLSSISCVCL